jgi:membrane-anchored glycerophosphoryl diester phosphodiesterase (GDPDase)
MNLFIILYIVGFVRTLLFIAIVYFAIKLFTRYVLPLILENKVKQMQQRMHEQQRKQEYKNKREGEVTIEYERKNNNIRGQGEGEYVDFEEVD